MDSTLHSYVTPLLPVERELIDGSTEAELNYIPNSFSTNTEQSTTSSDQSSITLSNETTMKRHKVYKLKPLPIGIECKELEGKSQEQIANDPELKAIRQKALSRLSSSKHRKLVQVKAVSEKQGTLVEIGNLIKEKKKTEAELESLKAAVHSGKFEGSESFVVTPTKAPTTVFSTPSPESNRAQRSTKKSSGKQLSTQGQCVEQKHDRSLKFGPHVIKKFIANFYNGSMKFEDFKRLRFDCFGIPVWGQLEDSNQDLKALTAACLDGLTCVHREMAGKCITQFQALATSLAGRDTGYNFAI